MATLSQRTCVKGRDSLSDDQGFGRFFCKNPAFLTFGLHLAHHVHPESILLVLVTML